MLGFGPGGSFPVGGRVDHEGTDAPQQPDVEQQPPSTEKISHATLDSATIDDNICKCSLITC